MNGYIHTIDGEPAYFSGEQIYFALNGISLDALIVPSLRKVHREQQASIAWRRKQGWKDDRDYGYLRVKVNKRSRVTTETNQP